MSDQDLEMGKELEEKIVIQLCFPIIKRSIDKIHYSDKNLKDTIHTN